MGLKAIPATVSPMTIFTARGEIDQTEGRGGYRKLGQFLTEKEAMAAAKGEGVMGHDGDVKREDVDVVVYHDPDTGEIVTRRLGDRVLVEFEDPKVIRANALAKLTPKEKKALGLK